MRFPWSGSPPTTVADLAHDRSVEIMDVSTVLMVIVFALGAIVWWRTLALILGTAVVALIILGVLAVMERFGAM